MEAPFIGNRARDVRAAWELEDINAIETQDKGDVPLTKQHVESTEDEIDGDLNGTVGLTLANDDVDMTWEEVRGVFSAYVCSLILNTVL